MIIIVMIIVLFYRANWIKIDGITFKTSAVVVIGKDEDYPVFGEICNIFCSNLLVTFEVKLLLFDKFVYHLHAYAIMSRPNSQHYHYLVSHDKLCDFHPYSLYPCPFASTKEQYVLLRNIVVSQ